MHGVGVRRVRTACSGSALTVGWFKLLARPQHNRRLPTLDSPVINITGHHFQEIRICIVLIFYCHALHFLEEALCVLHHVPCIALYNSRLPHCHRQHLQMRFLYDLQKPAF